MGQKSTKAAAPDDTLPEGEPHPGAMRAVARVVGPVFLLLGLAASARALVVAGFAADADATPLWITAAVFAFAIAAVSRDLVSGEGADEHATSA